MEIDGWQMVEDGREGKEHEEPMSWNSRWMEFSLIVVINMSDSSFQLQLQHWRYTSR